MNNSSENINLDIAYKTLRHVKTRGPISFEPLSALFPYISKQNRTAVDGMKTRCPNR